MADRMSRELALSVAGLAGFQLLQAWNANAPSLRDVRDAQPGDPVLKRQLIDADILVGGTAIILGSTIAILTKDDTALTVMVVMFGTTSLLHHYVLNRNPGGE